MPRFLEDRLRKQAKAKGMSDEKSDQYTFGVMNNMGVMHGSKITPKGEAMERKHEEDMDKKHRPLAPMHGGGDVPETGPYMLKKGETVIADEDDAELGHGKDVEDEENKGFLKRRMKSKGGDRNTNPMGSSHFQSNSVAPAPRNKGFLSSRMEQMA